MRLIALLTLLFLVGCSNNERVYKVPIVNFNSMEPLLNKSNDSTYVINFWATWCTPCVKEFPHFEKIADDFRDRKVKVIMVNLDFPDQYEKRLIPFLKSRNSNLDVIMLDDPDANSWINRVSPTWSGSLPFTVIYNANKRTFYEKTFELNELKNELNNHL